MKKKTWFAIIAFILSCIAIFVVGKIFIQIAYHYELIDDPNKILARYTIGSKLTDVKNSNVKILQEYDGPLEPSQFAITGYSLPKRGLNNGEKLLVIDQGEWIVYLYYDSKSILIYKSISGS